MTLLLTSIVIGMATGVLSGILGIGGGVILVPMLVFFLQVPQHMAQGVSMLVIIPTALVSIWHFHKNGMVDYRIAGCLAGGSVVGAIISANFVQYVPAEDLKHLFGVFVLITGAQMLLRKPKEEKPKT